MTEGWLQMPYELKSDPIFLAMLEDIKADRLSRLLYNGSANPHFCLFAYAEFRQRGGMDVPPTAVGIALSESLWEWWLEKKRSAAGSPLDRDQNLL